MFDGGEMENKKVIVLIVLAVAAVISLTYGILTPPKGRRLASEGPAVGRQLRNIRQTQAVKIIPRERSAKKTKYTSWGRNPFAPKKVIVAAPPPELILHGIVWYGGEPKAMINEEIVGIGDTISSRTVILIDQAGVTLSDGTKEYILKIEP
jgi:hypothetical protein